MIQIIRHELMTKISKDWFLGFLILIGAFLVCFSHQSDWLWMGMVFMCIGLEFLALSQLALMFEQTDNFDES
ncbi:hypothetical protein [Methylicorpusculum sp.]|uniref:hypothetical protein n=1 Tax=Methylicorpusculum sp. TaxID=2713644 RepID=UPI0027439422|nr:hypothetical protein [Methylicorpusculum sp.]MDP3528566.1 hypothetical protein [Methylicorpusculum sp.]MDZ4153420.1 hypothetical protein [Methylicorpusculum sp.]